MLSKLGLKPVKGCSRVTVRKGNQMVFQIADPEVLKGTDTYVIFGAFEMDGAAAQKAAVDRYQQAAAGEAAAPAAEAADEDDGDVDETGLDPKDIELVMSQVNTSRPKAVKALKESDGDLVKAIMSLQ